MSKVAEAEKPVVAVSAASKIKPEIKTLSEIIVGGLDVSKSDGVISEIRDNYRENLPPEVTPEIDDAITDYRQRFVAASALAVGTIAINTLRDNKKLDVVTAELRMGKSDITRHSVERHREYSYGSGADRRTSEKDGVLSSEVDIKGEHTTGQLKVVRNAVAELAAEVLKKKK